MSDQLAVDLRCRLGWMLRDASDLATVADISQLEYARTFSDGVATDEADAIWHHSGELSGGATDEWSLDALPRSVFGGEIEISLAKVKLVFLVNLGASAADSLQLQGGSDHPWTAPFGATGLAQAPADSCLLLTNRRTGWTVTPGVADTLSVYNPGLAPVGYQLVIVGATA